MMVHKAKTVKMFVIGRQEELNLFVKQGLEWLGFDVEVRVCSESTADWVKTPFLRDESGSWHGAEGIAAFMRKCGKPEERKPDPDVIHRSPDPDVIHRSPYALQPPPRMPPLSPARRTTSPYEPAGLRR